MKNVKQMFTFVLFLSLVQFANAQIRSMEPVIILGSELSALSGTSVDELYLFAYNDGAWNQIPMQLDEVSENGSLFEEDDALLDNNDELVFQPQDGGQLASLEEWIDNDDSKTHSRILLSIYDPVEEDSIFIYLYCSATLDNSDSTYYVSYNTETEEISSEYYLMGFDTEKKFWNKLQIIEEGILSNNLIDRQKTRIKGTVLFSPYTLTEEDFNPTANDLKTGKVRITRRVEGNFSISGVTQQVTGVGSYYRSYFATPNNSLDIHSSVQMIRNSIDLSAATVGSFSSDANNSSLTIDGSPDENVQENITIEQIAHYWLKIKLGVNSLVTVGDFSGMSNTNNLYFFDNASGGTGDGTTDTGDMVSFGDIGLKFDNPNSGNQVFASQTYAGIGVELSGPLCQTYFDNPFEIVSTTEYYDPTGIFFESSITSKQFKLLSNYPNPFNPSTVIDFSIPEQSFTKITVHDVLGKEVEVLVNENLFPGEHRVVYKADVNTPSGVYFAKLFAGNHSKTIKMLHIK